MSAVPDGRRVVRAFALAPLVAPAAYAAVLLGVETLRGFGDAPWPSVSAAGTLLLGIAGAGTPIAYAAALAGGVPAYVVLRRLGAVRRATLLPIAALVGAIAALAVAPSLRGDLISVPLPWWAGALLGLASGEAFWRLSRTD